MKYEELRIEDLKGFFPERPADCHKGNFGYVGIMGGSLEYSGAVKLALLAADGHAALRAGCGVSRVIVPGSIGPALSKYVLEETLALIPDEGGKMVFSEEELKSALNKLSALAVGPGWGRTDENRKILKYVLRNYDIPVVIDADGLNVLSDIPEHERNALLKETKCRVIMTPHPVEFQRLSGIKPEVSSKDPGKAASEYASSLGSENAHVILLKGATTAVSDGKTTYLVKSGAPGMATAGSGDVLTGVLAGLLGYLEPSPLTAAAGALIAGRAGILAQEDANPVSMTAGDTAAKIPSVISEILSLSSKEIPFDEMQDVIADFLCLKSDTGIPSENDYFSIDNDPFEMMDDLVSEYLMIGGMSSERGSKLNYIASSDDRYTEMQDVLADLLCLPEAGPDLSETRADHDHDPLTGMDEYIAELLLITPAAASSETGKEAEKTSSLEAEMAELVRGFNCIPPEYTDPARPLGEFPEDAGETMPLTGLFDMQHVVSGFYFI